MAHPASIRFDDVLGLLRSDLVQRVAAEYAARRGYGVSTTWGDTQRLTRELATAGITPGDLEGIARDDRAALFALSDAIAEMDSPQEEWPPGEEPDEAEEPAAASGPRHVSATLPLVHGCTLWLLRNRDHKDLEAWFKARRIPFSNQHAKAVQAAWRKIGQEHPRRAG